MVNFGRPIYNSRTNSYIIQLTSSESDTISGEPQYLDISSNDIKLFSPDTNTDTFQLFIKNFIQTLLAKDKEVKWFATPLRENSILRRLQHTWKERSLSLIQEGWYTITWIPSALEITPNEFILNWTIQTMNESTPRISSRFLSLSEPPTPRSVSPQSKEESIRQFTYLPGQANELEQVFDIPLTQSEEIDLEEEKQERQVIREARLRVELAQMKLEKHLQNYYHKYGNIPDETDSETTESSLEED
jgi:hypothetical protein